jgi:hypothetical protein
MESLQALEAGNANERQQKEVLRWLIHDACKTYDLSYRPGESGRRDTDFAEGKRFVGLQVVTLLKVNTTEVRRRMNEST